MKHPSAIKYMMSNTVFIILLVCAGLAFAGIPTEVVLNKSVLLNLKNPAERLSVANPSIADVNLISPRQVQINGTALGATTMIVWERGGEKPVFFDLKVIGDQSLIESQIREIAPDDPITVQYSNDTAVLTGKAGKYKTRAKAEEIAKSYSAKVLNYINVDEPQQVLLQVKVAQVDKTSLKKLGISGMMKGKTAEGFYNTSVGVPSGGSTTSTTSTGTGFSSTQVGSGTGISGNVPGLGSFNPLDAFQIGVSYFPSGIGAVIQALATKNLAKILAEPNLLVKSGEKGEFMAGSKIPYNIVTTSGGQTAVSIFFVDVGIKLNFAPEVLDNGMISLKIDPAEVSSVAGTLQVNGYPIIDTRNVRTNVELRDGESLVLAGLLQEDQIRTMSKIPILGDIPILGALFRSTEKDITEKELVFFITPKLMKPTAPGVKTKLPTDERPTPKEERELQWIPLGS
jgi:pilus assembly protein CpaC